MSVLPKGGKMPQRRFFVFFTYPFLRCVLRAGLLFFALSATPVTKGSPLENNVAAPRKGRTP